MVWTSTDYQLLHDLVADRKMVLVADTSLGIPTIHGFRGAEHIGFGYFVCETPEYTIEFEGGGAMARTPSGKGYSIAKVTDGSFAYPFDAVLETLSNLLQDQD